MSNALLSVALPILVIGGLTFFLLAYHLDIIETSFARSRDAVTNDIARTDLVSRATTAASQIDTFMVSRITEARAWATSKVVVEAARFGRARHAAEGFRRKRPPPRRSKRGSASKRAWDSGRKPIPSCASRSRRRPYFAEIFFTDSNGFNVALTNPTSDFIQSDEGMVEESLEPGDFRGRGRIRRLGRRLVRGNLRPHRRPDREQAARRDEDGARHRAHSEDRGQGGTILSGRPRPGCDGARRC